MAQFIVHVGPHKTATTAIQMALSALQAPLAAKGICVPSVWESAPGLPSHMRFARAIEAGDIEPVERELRAFDAAGYHTVVISCERLSRLSIEDLTRLRLVLGSSPVQIVYYVRRWPERLPSLWQETVKFGHVAGLAEYLVAQFTNFVGSEMRDVTMLDRLASVFGEAPIRIAAYSAMTDRGLDIVRHFFDSFLNAADVAIPDMGRVNTSLPIYDTEIIRALNAIHLSRGGEPSTVIREWYMRRGSGLVPASIVASMQRDLATLRLDESQPPSLRILRDMLDRYGRCVVMPRHANGLHEPRVLNVTFIRGNYLLASKAADALAGLYDAYRHEQG